MADTFDALRGQLTDAAEALADGPAALAGILAGIVDDVDRALTEPLEIFPVCHHSPASALAMVRRLREKQPKVIYLELCEDLRPLLGELRNCHLPVAVQAFASTLDGFPKDWGPLSVVAPITEASAEYQAIAYALDTPGVELVLVDRSADHVFQWLPQAEDGVTSGEPPAEPTDAESDDAALHGDAVGVEIGDLRPRFAELEEHLLRHGKVRHWSEWWDQYVEQPLASADYDTYRQVLVLIGSLFRRLRPADSAKLDRDEDRERYMWTRMREHLASSGADAADCLYVCGAFHAASRVEEFGVAGAQTFTISPPTATKWLYGLIPSSHSSIEAQFGLASGSVSIAAATWTKSVARSGLSTFQLAGQQGSKKKAPKKAAVAPAAAPAEPVTDRLTGFLSRPPQLDGLDEAELLGWCVDIVRLARRNGYLSSTADAIAVFETSILLAGMRNRARPTPYDFQDAAVTCIEKDVVPGRRDVRRLCEILMGGDRIGRVGYDALPPLARDVYDRLSPLGMDLEKRTVQRALLDLQAHPEQQPASDLLWRLRYLMPAGAVRPIMGERRLGTRSIQESWDLAIGRDQRALIELGYEGVTIEQVLEQRLRRAVWHPQATAAKALAAGVRVTYQAAAAAVEAGVRDGVLLRGEVLARWQELVGTGEFMRSIQTRVGWLRDRIVDALTGRPPAGDTVTAALESGLVTLVRAAAADAAEQAARAWRLHPAGAALLTPSLSAPSADLTERIERMVRDWQRGVLELVRTQAGNKRFTARASAYAVNALGLVVMIAVFTATSFIPTGAEIVVAGGTTIAAQKLLEAIFGDQAVRELADQARRDLLERVGELLDAEADRYRAVLDGAGVDPGAGDRLRRAAAAVRSAHVAAPILAGDAVLRPLRGWRSLLKRREP